MGKFFFVQIKNKIDSFFTHSLLGSPMSFPFLTQFIEQTLLLVYFLSAYFYCIIPTACMQRLFVVTINSPYTKRSKGSLLSYSATYIYLSTRFIRLCYGMSSLLLVARRIEFVVKDIRNCQNAQKHQRKKSLSIYAVDSSMAYCCKNKIEGKTCISPFFYSFWNLRNDQC